MRHLLILCHPSTESLCHLITAELLQLFQDHDIAVELRDLYKMDFKPVLTRSDLNAAAVGKVMEDVAAEQEAIADADVITFLYPIWFSGIPAMLRGYIERVFCESFAYSLSKKGKVKKLLEGKSVVLINTFNSEKSLVSKDIVHSMAFTSERNIFEAFGMEIILQHFVEKADLDGQSDSAKLKITELKDNIKSTLIVGNNIRLNIPTTFF